MMERQPGMDQAQNTEKLDVGGVLREARESMDMSVEDVAGRLKFAPRQIAALEEGNYDQLPEMAFVRGFVRSYARLLHLDAAPLLDALPGAPSQAEPPEKKSREDFLPNVNAARKHNILWLGAALVVALAIGMLAWQYDRGQAAPKPAADAKPASDAKPGEQTKSVVAAANIPVMMPVSAVADAEPDSRENATPNAASAAAQAATPNVAANAAHKLPARALLLEFDEDSWVEVKDGNGKILLSHIGLRGSEQSFNGTLPFSVVIGNAHGVRLYYKGDLVDLDPYTIVDVAHLTLE
ncbi:MAG TPA: RodZ domain-containing protein [Gallionellaceae bacterium]|nr:RodZ domain-containing protein [Gallionellaceae bacterium]